MAASRPSPGKYAPGGASESAGNRRPYAKQQEGNPALWAAHSYALRDALARSVGRIEFVELSHQYLQLTSLVGIA